MSKYSHSHKSFVCPFIFDVFFLFTSKKMTETKKKYLKFFTDTRYFCLCIAFVHNILVTHSIYFPWGTHMKLFIREEMIKNMQGEAWVTEKLLSS